MNEDILNVEQPNVESVQTTAVESNEGIENLELGSTNFGKFKDAKSLYDAYNELQSEFTRKCQKLSELESKQLDNVAEITPKSESSWQECVSDFIKSHKHAQAYSKDITNEFMKDVSPKQDRHGLEVAYSRVMDSKFQSRDELMKDESFIQDIIENDSIKKQIINNYLNSLNRAPTVLHSASKSVSLMPKAKPTNLNDARKIVEDMLKY